MKAPLLSTDADFTLAAILGVISLGAVIGLASAEQSPQPIHRKVLVEQPGCEELLEPSPKAPNDRRVSPGQGPRRPVKLG